MGGLVAIIWVAVVHLRRSPNVIMGALLLAMSCSAPILAQAWPITAGMLGVHGNLPEYLMQSITMLYTTAVALLFVSGGPLALLAGVLIAQLVAKVHGPEILMKAFEAAIK